MEPSTTFQQMVAGIESAYATMGHTLGWRFLCVSKQVLEQHPKIALITANPGGSTFEGSAASCENGCAYLAERWGGSAPGKSSLQQQVQQLFASLAQFVGEGQTGSQLMEASLIGYFVPFRSPRIAALPHIKSSLAFAQQLWTGVLDRCHPELIITIDPAAFAHACTIVQARYPALPPLHQRMETGWGDISAEVVRFGSDAKVTTVVRLPHLSTFKLFSRPACKPFLAAILTEATRHLSRR